MTPLPPPLGPGGLRFWRIDQQRYSQQWDRGEGAFRVGGRWNSPGIRAVYASCDPATACLEVAVHKGFDVLDTAPHVLTHARITDLRAVYVVQPEDVPNPNWLAPVTPNTHQQRFGDSLLAAHQLVLIPSAVSHHSWNLVFDAARTEGLYDDVRQERFALDPRLQA